MFRQSPNAYVIFDEALTIVGCNSAYLEAVGRQSSVEIVGRNVFEAFPSPQDSPGHILLRRSLDRVIETHKRDHIAVIPYDTSAPGEPANMRYWSATHTPLFDSEGKFRYILQHTVDVTELQRLREGNARSQIVEAGVLQRARAIQSENQLISAERELLQDMFEQAPGFIGILAGPAHTFILANEAYIRLVGGRDLVGKTVADAMPEVIGQGFVDILDRVYRTGERYVGESVAVSLQTEAGGKHSEHFVDFVYQPILSDDGKVSGIFVQGNDVTAKVAAERQRSIQTRELAHRLKNQLAIVQAVVNQSLRSVADIETGKEVITGRLSALASAHESLISGHAGETTVGEIVAKTVELHGEGWQERFQITGPEVRIGSQVALSLSLIMHELFTNAVKHGALSNDSGSAVIEWDTSHDGESGQEFHLLWRERGGPPVSEPERAGAGSRLIRAGLSGTTSSHVTMAFAPTGLVCELKAELGDFQP